MNNFNERLRELQANVVPHESKYAVVYERIIRESDGYGDYTAESVQVFKSFDSVAEFNDWVIEARQRFEAFEIIPLTVKTHVSVTATRH